MSIYVLMRKGAIALSQIVVILALTVWTTTLPSKGESHSTPYEEGYEDPFLYRMAFEAQKMVQSPNFWKGMAATSALNNAHHLNINFPRLLDDFQSLGREEAFWKGADNYLFSMGRL